MKIQAGVDRETLKLNHLQPDVELPILFGKENITKMLEGTTRVVWVR